MNKMISVLGMLAVLAAGLGLDRLIGLLRQENGRTFNLAPFFWISGLIDLVFVSFILILAWFFLFRSGHSIALSLVFLIVGLLLLFSRAIFALVPTLPIGFPQPFDDFVLVTPNSYASHAAALLAILGAAGLAEVAGGFRPMARNRVTASRS